LYRNDKHNYIVYCLHWFLITTFWITTLPKKTSRSWWFEEWKFQIDLNKTPLFLFWQLLNNFSGNKINRCCFFIASFLVWITQTKILKELIEIEYTNAYLTTNIFHIFPTCCCTFLIQLLTFFYTFISKTSFKSSLNLKNLINWSVQPLRPSRDSSSDPNNDFSRASNDAFSNDILGWKT